MKKFIKKTYLILIVLLILSGCNHNYLTYSGEGEFWEAKQEVTQLYGSQKSTYYIVYKGDNFEEIKNTKVSFSFNSPHDSYSGTSSIYESNVLELGITDGKTFLLNENDKISFSIEWDNGKQEEFMLTSEN